MKKILLLALLLATAISHNADDDDINLTEEEKIKLRPKPSHIEQCKEGFPYLGAGDFNLTSENYTQ